MSTTWDALQARLDGLKRPTATLTICPDDDARQRLNVAKAELQGAEEYLASLADPAEGDNLEALNAEKAAAETRVKAAKSELTAAQKAFDKTAITLTFQALERQKLIDLEKEHPASEEEEANGAEHASSFAPALVSASSVDGMPLEYARHCLDTWSLGDSTDLYNAAVSVQRAQRTDLGKG